MPPLEAPRRAGSSRPLPRWLLMLAAALLVARIGTGVYEHLHPADSPTSDGQTPTGTSAGLVAWVPASQAEAESRRTGKPILYEFGAEWCGPCHMLTDQVFADPAAAAQIAQMYVPVRIVDRQKEEGHNPPETERLMSAYSVNEFPTLIATWPGGSNYESKGGYMGRAATLQWLGVASVRMRAQAPGAAVDSTIYP